MPNPFTNTGRIEDPRYFFGRTAELDAIFDRLGGVQLGSVNVVGERRIGRSSLLWHVKTIAPQRLPDRFRVGCLELQSDTIDSPESFRACALREWGIDVVEDGRLKRVPADMFENLLIDMRSQQIKPVLLLDEFESIVESSKAFKDTFFDGLRSLCNRNLLACVYVTRKSLAEYKTSHPVVSTLHGLCIKVDLGDLEEDEVRALLSQPTEYTFNASQIQLARQWAGYHPLKLNLAANHIYEQLAHEKGKWSAAQEEITEKKFRDDVAYIFALQPVGSKVKRAGSSMWSGWSRFTDWVESHKVMTGFLAAMIVVVLLLLFGLITLPQLLSKAVIDAIGTATPMPTATPLPPTPTP